MKQSTQLSTLATTLATALPEGALKMWALQMADYHAGNALLVPVYPAGHPQYGAAVSEAITAIKMGWTSHVARLIEVIVRAAGPDGILKEKKVLVRPIRTMPQPNSRKSFDSGRTPRAGGEILIF